MHMHAHTRTHMYTHVHTHTRTHARMCTHTRTHTHARVRTHTRTQNKQLKALLYSTQALLQIVITKYI